MRKLRFRFPECRFFATVASFVSRNPSWLRLRGSFGVRMIRAVAGSPRLYDSAFDPPAVVKKKAGTHASHDPRGDQDDGLSPGGISVLSGSPLTTWSSLPLTARSQTEYDLQLRPTHR